MAKDDIEVRRAFAKRLLNFRVAKGWNQSEFARQAALYTPAKKFNRDNISKYEAAKILPLPVHLNALAKALGRSAEDLLPEVAHGLTTPMEGNPAIAVQTVEGDSEHAWLRINQRVDTDLAFKILGLLRKTPNADT